MEENGFEKYSKIFEEIEKNLNKDNFVGIEDVSVCDTLSRKEVMKNCRHFTYNGLHIYKSGVITFISNGEYTEDKARLELYKTDTSPELDTITLKLKHAYGKIVYGKEGRAAAPHLGEGRDYSFLPTRQEMDNIRNYEEAGNFSADLTTILESAKEKAEDEQTRTAYIEAMDLDDRIEDAYTVALVQKTREDINANGIDAATQEFLDEYGYPSSSTDFGDDEPQGLSDDEKRSLDELNDDRENDNQMFTRAKDFTPDELEQMSTEELEGMLRATEDENNAKRKMLEQTKKKELISKIRVAVAEGKELDSQIATIRETTKEK